MRNTDLIDNLTQQLNHAESVMQLLANDFDEHEGDFSLNPFLISNAFGCAIHSILNAMEIARELGKAKAQQENNAPDITGRTVASITILKGE